MRDVTRPCTECGESVVAPRITCGPTCRSRRSRRIRDRRASGREVNRLVTDEAERAAQEILKDELKPVVREALTEEVLAGIQSMIGHVPAAIEAAAADLASDDDVTRQKAYTLILKHTLGSSNLVPDINAEKQQELTVHFNLPRPEAARSAEWTVAEGDDPVEGRECDSCSTVKPASEFVGESHRCRVCFERMRAAADTYLGAGTLDA